MEESYGTGVLQGVVMYIALIGLLLFGGAAFWFGYRVFGVIVMVGAAVLLAAVAASSL